MAVRKDPINDKGPCIGCKDNTPKIAAEFVEMFTSKTLPDAQYERLWNHVTIGCTTTINMIESYADVGMPKADLTKLTSLRDRLTRVLDTYKELKDEEDPTPEPSTPDPVDGEDEDGGYQYEGDSSLTD